MKRIISIILALIFVCAGFVSCGNKNYDDFLTVNYNYDLSEYIELGNYKELVVITEPYSVDEETYVQIQIQSSLTYYARDTKVNRAAKIGDTVYINSVATIDGVPFAGGTVSNRALLLGSSEIGAEYEGQLVGLSAGDKTSFDISVPNDSNEYAELRGKTVHYEVEILSVCEKELPEYTDAFVKAYLGYDSREAYEAKIIEDLKANYQKGVYSDIIPQAWDIVFANTNVIKYPEKELRQKYENLVAGVQDYANVKGLTMAQMVKAAFNMTEDEFYAYAQEEAKSDVKEEMICYAIARAENLVLTDEEYEKRALTIAKDVYGLTSVAQLEEKYDIDTIKKGILLDMAKERMADLCIIAYSDADSVVVPTVGGITSEENHDHDHDHEGEVENDTTENE